MPRAGLQEQELALELVEVEERALGLVLEEECILLASQLEEAMEERQEE